MTQSNTNSTGVNKSIHDSHPTGRAAFGCFGLLIIVIGSFSYQLWHVNSKHVVSTIHVNPPSTITFRDPVRPSAITFRDPDPAFYDQLKWSQGPRPKTLPISFEVIDGHTMGWHAQESKAWYRLNSLPEGFTFREEFVTPGTHSSWFQGCYFMPIRRRWGLINDPNPKLTAAIRRSVEMEERFFLSLPSMTRYGNQIYRRVWIEKTRVKDLNSGLGIPLYPNVPPGHLRTNYVQLTLPISVGITFLPHPGVTYPTGMEPFEITPGARVVLDSHAWEKW